MLKDPSHKYRPFPAIDLADRQWCSRALSKAPIWLSTDLRDGNQALFEPMGVATKLRLFKELVRIGFKEIEVGFPAASQVDYDFMRHLIDGHHIPDDVTPMVLTQARADLIKRSVESMQGARSAIVHIYNATAPAWREIVFSMSVAEMMNLVKTNISLLKELTDAAPETEWILQYSPETFSMTELEVSLEACNTAIEAWHTGPDRKIIINLPTTVENATPNIFADQIEWMHKHLHQRENVILSVHTHNDRGTGVAAAEFAQMAGAERVEGCLFGNGERSGNVDIVTLALNLYTQGISPGLDFSAINAVASVVEECTQLPIHPRHPYVGDLVFTSFSGSHQDAIQKGFAVQENNQMWAVPYLPIDPADLGRTYDSVIRVNSQSGKGGISYLLERDYGVVMPRRMKVEFSAEVQRQLELNEAEMTSAELWALFNKTYLEPESVTQAVMSYTSHRLFEHKNGQELEIMVTSQDELYRFVGIGTGPIEATISAFNIPLDIRHYEERSIGAGANARALAVIEISHVGTTDSRFGAGISTNIITASLMAVISGINRLGMVESLLKNEITGRTFHLGHK